MKTMRARRVVGFDASAVSAAAVSRGLRRRRVRALAQAPLAPGALVPSPFAPNLRRPAEVVAALRRVITELGGAEVAACLVLPDGVARLAVFDLPDDVTPEAYLRYRLAPGLPYPADEAVIETLSLGGRRVVAAAVRREVLEGYEAVAGEAGITQERVDLAPLAALARLAEAAAGPGTVDIVLGDVAICLAAHAAEGMRVVRSRWRDRAPDEPRRLAAEADRTARLAGMDGARRLRVVGAGAAELLQALREQGRAAEPGWTALAEGLPQGGLSLGWVAAALS